jgi:hypothetical protein
MSKNPDPRIIIESLAEKFPGFSWMGNGNMFSRTRIITKAQVIHVRGDRSYRRPWLRPSVPAERSRRGALYFAVGGVPHRLTPVEIEERSI